ncbi:MAG TPA: hypothetical protein VFU28_07015 [Vicinamibacterales bacterium]|nr:hypothetical protein [Vicinamibacterales bacterium]
MRAHNNKILGGQRGHERIAIDTRDEGGRWRRIALHVGSRVAFS